MRVYVIHVSSRYPSLKYWTHWSVLCKMGDINRLSLSASRTDSRARSSCPEIPPARISFLCKKGDIKGLSLSASRTDSIAQSTCPSDFSSQCFPSCGAPAHPPHSNCTTSYKVNLLGSILPTKARTPWPAGPTTMLTK